MVGHALMGVMFPSFLVTACYPSVVFDVQILRPFKLSTPKW